MDKCEVAYALSHSPNINQPVLLGHQSDEHLLVQTKQDPISLLEEFRAWKVIFKKRYAKVLKLCMEVDRILDLCLYKSSRAICISGELNGNI